LIPVVIGIFH